MVSLFMEGEVPPEPPAAPDRYSPQTSFAKATAVKYRAGKRKDGAEINSGVRRELKGHAALKTGADGISTGQLNDKTISVRVDFLNRCVRTGNSPVVNRLVKKTGWRARFHPSRSWRGGKKLWSTAGTERPRRFKNRCGRFCWPHN
ncbi:hypothetical protein [Pontiella desulfatans]|uniref:hypothetical protein n=1 Tax=Pontiella desulfatans TaxID=2750659 RepID=UPI00109D0D83|nr:hypothetical protein [Pontiella desulfatans]